MEPDDLKAAWRALGQRLERQEEIQWQLLRDRKLDKVRSSLRPLFWGQALQAVLGLCILLLGVACWTRNTDVPGLFATGILLHAFGVVTIVMASITMSLIASVDYAAPVMKIQKKFALLRRFYAINANVCGLPWWIMWVLVVVGFAGLGEVDPSAGTPVWISASLAIGVVGWLATMAAMYWQHRRRAVQGRQESLDESQSIRRGRRLLDEVARFERE
ncbi:hypothetical protein [Pseudoxanthomonas putridarboris]|uniref:Serine/threonine protein kinase n=1 Tax=Pseudoxanthomonas putridarboris TaxID=752605 RepID=A0ABU9J449_9GAMM